MPTLLRKALTHLTGGNIPVQKASRGSMSSFVIGAPHQYGQPPEAVFTADVQGLITTERMREIVMKCPTPAACLNAALDYLAGVPIGIRNVDPSKKPNPREVSVLQDYMNRPNANDTWRRFRLKIYRDLLTLGMAAAEKEPNTEGGIYALNPLDAGRLRIDYDEHGVLLGYNMIDSYGRPISTEGTPWAWLPDEVILFSLNPVSHSLYPTSRISQLFVLGVIESLMMAYIGERFTSSNVPYGLLDLGEITDTELQAAIESWNGQAQRSHKIILTGSRGSSKWYPFAYNLKELEAPALLADIRMRIMGILGVTMNELGESQDVSKSNGYNLSYTFKKRVVEPPLDEFCTSMTRGFIWDGLGFRDSEYFYQEIDSRDELLQANIDEVYLKSGIFTPNMVANRKGIPNVAGGDDRMIFTGSAWIPLDMIRPFAQGQLDAIQAEVAALQSGEGSGGVSPPITRATKMPESYTTPDGAGSSTFKLLLPKPKQSKKDGTDSPPQKPRGTVQAMRNTGLRKEDMHQL